MRMAADDIPARSLPLSEDALDERAAVLDTIYDVALDPSRLPELLEVWEVYLRAVLARGEVGFSRPFDDPAVETRLRRATAFLDRTETLERAAERGGSILDGFARAAGFLGDGGPQILSFNPAAASAFGLSGQARLADLPFDAGEIDELAGAMRRAAAGRQIEAAMIRVHSRRTGAPVILRVSPVMGDGSRPLALVLSSELVWPEGLAEALRSAFGLTPAEVEIVRAVTEGKPLREVAEARGRSAQTVKTQMRSILSKTETHSQQDLVRVMLGLMELMDDSGLRAAANLPYSGQMEPVAFREMRASDGRVLEWIEMGSPTGAPLLVIPQVYMFIRWPAAAEAEAERRGIRVIVPIRAGYGRSSPMPKNVDFIQANTSDYLAILEHLSIRSCAVLSFGAELRQALSLSLRDPAMVRGIVSVGTQLPIRKPAQLQQMSKWHRFIISNAFFAPKFLPFLIRVGFAFARQLGKEALLRQVNEGSAADTALFDDPETREALLMGSDVTLGPRYSAHEAYAMDVIDATRDWSWLLIMPLAPVLILHGDEDPQSPLSIIREQITAYPRLSMEQVEGAGQLLFFTHWARVMDRLEPYLPR